MIVEQGTIKEIKGASALIEAKRSAECESCASKALCSPDSDDMMLIEADNPVGAEVGNKVLFSMPASAVLKAGTLVYLLPLICFIIGVVIGQIAVPVVAPELNKDLVSAAIGFIFVVFAFGFIRYYGRSVERTNAFRPTVTKIL